MATEKISEIEYSLGEKNTILDWFFELGSHCVLDAENWKFFRTLRIGSLPLDIKKLHPISLFFWFSTSSTSMAPSVVPFSAIFSLAFPHARIFLIQSDASEEKTTCIYM